MTENAISYKAIGAAIEIYTSIGFCPVALRFLRKQFCGLCVEVLQAPQINRDIRIKMGHT